MQQNLQVAYLRHANWQGNSYFYKHYVPMARQLAHNQQENLIVHVNRVNRPSYFVSIVARTCSILAAALLLGRVAKFSTIRPSASINT